jgi:hypothetical protein
MKMKSQNDAVAFSISPISKDWKLALSLLPIIGSAVAIFEKE